MDNQNLELINPKQIAAVVRPDVTFTVNNELSEPTMEDHNEPLGLYHKSFALFKAALFTSGKSLTANIKVNEIPEIAAKTEFCRNREYEMAVSGKVSAQGNADPILNNPAFNTKFRAGNMKGMTPFDVYRTDPDWYNSLMRQRGFLYENLQKYKGNQELITAIDNLIDLLNKKLITQENIAGLSAGNTANKFSICKIDMRPLRSRKQANGKCFVYGVSIDWIFGEGAPVMVTIENYFADVEQKPDGRLNVHAKTAENRQTLSITMTSSEWSWVVYMMQSNMKNFETLEFERMLKAANDAARRKLEKHKQEKQTPATSPAPDYAYQDYGYASAVSNGCSPGGNGYYGTYPQSESYNNNPYAR